MRSWLNSWRTPRPGADSATAFRTGILLLPAPPLLVEVLRTTGRTQALLALGTLSELMVCYLTFTSSRSWRLRAGPSLIALYLIALGWLWLGSGRASDWYLHLAQAVLVIVPLLIFGV